MRHRCMWHNLRGEGRRYSKAWEESALWYRVLFGAWLNLNTTFRRVERDGY